MSVSKEWKNLPEVQSIIDSVVPSKIGTCIWFTGLSGAGKSTIANGLMDWFRKYPKIGINPTLLDGDVIRTTFSKGLGFSKEDRDENINRVGYVANEIVKKNGVVICACISPYSEIRNNIRRLCGSHHFIEVWVATPLAVCEQRDTKGLYKKARLGEIKDFTGIDAPYQNPDSPDVRLNADIDNIENCVKSVLVAIESKYDIILTPNKDNVITIKWL